MLRDLALVVPLADSWGGTAMGEGGAICLGGPAGNATLPGLAGGIGDALVSIVPLGTMTGGTVAAAAFMKAIRSTDGSRSRRCPAAGCPIHCQLR